MEMSSPHQRICYHLQRRNHLMIFWNNSTSSSHWSTQRLCINMVTLIIKPANRIQNWLPKQFSVSWPILKVHIQSRYVGYSTNSSMHLQQIQALHLEREHVWKGLDSMQNLQPETNPYFWVLKQFWQTIGLILFH